MRRFFPAAAVLGLVLATEAAARPKTDVLTLRNGDRITCEIKQLTRGKLTVKTDDAGTLDIEWTAISGVRSGHYFRVEDRFGRRFFGAVNMEFGGAVEIGGEEGIVTMAPFDVVEIRELQRSFWEQQDGSLSFGFSFTKASNVAQLTLDWSNVWRTERNLVDLKAQTIITDRGDEDERAVREDFSLGYTRYLAFDAWTGTLTTAYQRNDELALAGRFIASTATGVTPIKSNLNVLLINVGIAVNRERSTNTDSLTTSGEGVLSADYSLFKYNSPKSDIKTSLIYYPSLTEGNRYRIDFNLKVRHELISDFYIDLSYWTNFDSNAPGSEGKKSDYGIVTSISYSY
jgi:hypothetical protein